MPIGTKFLVGFFLTPVPLITINAFQYLYRMMSLPKKLEGRKDEITRDFLKLVDRHIEDLVTQKVDHVYHAKDFASFLFIHPRHLSNTIKLTLGKSPCDIMEERLLDEAKRMLRDTDMSVAEIGYRLTYSEPTNFVKFYKLMTGTTPLRDRKQMQRPQELQKF